MIIFHPRQSDCARRACKNEKSVTFNFTSQIASLICTVAFTKCEKFDAIIFTSRCSRRSLVCIFRQAHALLLSQAKVARLANGSPKLVRSPARRSRNGRDMTDKTICGMSPAFPRNFPAIAGPATNAMSLDDRQADSQDNLRHAGLDAQCPRRKLARQPATWLRNGGVTALPQFAQRPTQHLVSSSSDSRRQLSTMTFKNYEYANQTNARS